MYTRASFVLLGVIVFSLLVSCQAQNPILMTDFTDASALNKYSTPSLTTPTCSFSYSLLFSQQFNDGAIIIPLEFPISSTVLISSSANEYLYQVNTNLPTSATTFQVKALSNTQTNTFNINFKCETPPTTLDIQFFNNNTLYDSYSSTTYGPVLTFQVINFFKYGSPLDATFPSQTLVKREVTWFSENIYYIAFDYSVGANKWSDLYDDVIINIQYSENPSWAPASNHIIKSNYKSANNYTLEYSFFGLDSNSNTINKNIFPIVKFTTTENKPNLWYFKTNSPNLLNSRGLICMGNYTKGVIIQTIAKEGLLTDTLTFAYNNITHNMVEKSINYNYLGPTPTFTLIKTDTANRILSSSVTTDTQVPALFVMIKSGLNSLYVYNSDGIYPYGILLRTSNIYTRIDEFFVSILSNGPREFNYDGLVTSFDFGATGLYDTTPPNIQSIQQYRFGNINIFSVHITDDLSGFYRLQGIGDFTSLVSGNLQDGVYEFKLDLEKQFLLNNDLPLCDSAFSCKGLNLKYFKATDNSTFKLDEFKLVSEINRIYWKYNDIDVSEKGLNNVLYICSAIKTYQPHILPATGLRSYTEINSILGVYNNSNGCYQFIVPIHKNYITGNYNAYLWLGYAWEQFSYL
ncbi:hypothetical protein CYY_010406, partial [Polysphondylium violaceum]